MSAAPLIPTLTMSANAGCGGRITSALHRRLIALTVALPCAIVLGLAAWMTPSPTGIGTHRQIGGGSLPPCGWIVFADMPCPTCGMTTAFAHAADGNFTASFLAQPLGFVLAISVAMALLVSIYVVVTASRVGVVFGRLWGRRAGWTLSAMVVAAWLYKLASYKGWLS